MKLWVLVIAGTAALAILALGFPRSSTLRYRMTVAVQTPQGVRSGSSVMEARIVRQIPLMGADAVRYEHEGEAVAVDLPDGSTLFGLLGQDAYHVALPTHGWRRGTAVPDVTPEMPTALRERDAADWPVLRRLAPSMRLVPQDYPLFARFSDIPDARSLELFAADQFSAALGPDYRLLEVTIQPTEAPLEWTIERRLAWLGTSVTNYLPGEVARSRGISTLNFQRRR